MQATSTSLVRCSKHSQRGCCWINFNGLHVPVEQCLCLVAGYEGWQCPIDVHAQRWRNENPEHGSPFLPFRRRRIAEVVSHIPVQKDLFRRSTRRFSQQRTTKAS